MQFQSGSITAHAISMRSPLHCMCAASQRGVCGADHHCTRWATTHTHTHSAITSWHTVDTILAPYLATTATHYTTTRYTWKTVIRWVASKRRCCPPTGQASDKCSCLREMRRTFVSSTSQSRWVCAGACEVFGWCTCEVFTPTTRAHTHTSLCVASES